MRLALVQLRLTHESHSRTMQHLRAAVADAANTNPAPDLIVLPGAADAESAPNAATLESMKESIAHLAREWGVYIAVGLRTLREKNPEACAVLFDADGDVVTQSPRTRGVDRPLSEWPDFHPSPYGAIGVVEPTARDGTRAFQSTAGGDRVMAVPVGGAMNKQSSRATPSAGSFFESISAHTAAHWAVVVPADAASTTWAMEPESVASFLRAPDGSLLAAAENLEETILFADVPIVPRSPNDPAPVGHNEVKQADLRRGRASGGLP